MLTIPAPAFSKGLYTAVKSGDVKNEGDGIQTHKTAHFCRRHRNRVVIPPTPTKAVVAQRRANVGTIGIGRKLPLTEQYRWRRYEMPASHSAVRRTLAGRGDPEPPRRGAAPNGAST